MKRLPSFLDYIEERPDDYTEFVQRRERHMIASPRDHEWWSLFLSSMREIVIFETPLRNDAWTISPHFGYYGRRFHPVEGVPLYFHTGIDFQAPVRTPVFPVTDGVLEYSGYGLHNGNYVLMSHPDVMTEDGYRLTSSYMHLRSYDVFFSSYQKMLREISLHTHPIIPIYRDTKIGELGSSGMHTDVYPHVHVQLDFRKEGFPTVAFNPIELFDLSHHENFSATVSSQNDFKRYYQEHKDELKSFDPLWKKGLK